MLLFVIGAVTLWIVASGAFSTVALAAAMVTTGFAMVRRRAGRAAG
ncbi:MULTISPECIES: hypothetical protein [unclassified Curtobacterium]|nr:MULTISPECIES: hypothetical protein [unclassified Curtobacterium]